MINGLLELRKVVNETVIGNIFMGSLFTFDAIVLVSHNQILAILFILLAARRYVRALYLHLLDSEKGRRFLKKLPIKKIQEEATRFYDEE